MLPRHARVTPLLDGLPDGPGQTEHLFVNAVERVRRPPLFAWRMGFRLRAEVLDPAMLIELERRLGSYELRARVDDGELLVHMRIVGHGGPAGAMGDAAQMLAHHAAGAGLRGARIEVVHAVRVSASATGAS